VTAQTRGVANGHRRWRLSTECDQSASLLAAALNVFLGRTVAGFASQLLTLIPRVLEEELPLGGGGELRHLDFVALNALGGPGISRWRFGRDLSYRRLAARNACA
jgi:hypothetical protein